MAKEDLENLERQIIELVAIDRLYIPSSSFDGKLKRRRKKVAESIETSKKGFEGERTYARIEEEDKKKAKDMRAGIEEFCKDFPKYGRILNAMIEKERVKRERHLYFGMLEGRRLATEDYMYVLKDMGLSPAIAEEYYDVAMEISRNLVKKREEKERSVLIGGKEYEEEED